MVKPTKQSGKEKHIQEKKKVFSIATYNIQGSNNPNAILQTIAQLVKNGVQVFCLQEIRSFPRKAFIGDILQKHLGKDWKLECFLQKDKRSHELGLCILWNSNILQMQTVAKIFLPRLQKRTFTEFCEEKLLFTKKSFLQRKALVMNFTIGMKKIRITNVHLDWQGGPVHRKNQLEFLLDALRGKDSVEYEIVCGDFNTVKWPRVSDEKKYLSPVLGEKFIDVSADIPWTANLNTFSFYGILNNMINGFIKKLHIHIYNKIDYIWSCGLICSECKVFPAEGSDHIPLVATFQY